MITEVLHVISNELLTEQLDEELVVLDLRSGAYYGLSAVATRFWALLQQGKTPAQAHAVLLDEYEVSSAQLTRDLTSLLGTLASHGLVMPIAL